MTYPAENVVILGLGLIGGSLARALRKSGFSQRFIGYGHRQPSLERGVELGVIDEFTLDLDEAIDRADILVIATPTLVASDMLLKILPRLEGRANTPVITDVASVKGSLQRTAESLCGKMPEKLVLAHPIAGSERSGVNASAEDLFVNHRVILTPVEGNDTAAVELIRQMWPTCKPRTQ
jgi:cyclohexadieny/prephenate dehydrogenase